MIQTKELTDSLLTAYLDYSEYSVTPKTNGDGKQISFEVTGENVNDAIQRFYLNPKIPILNFCSSYKKIRSMIFNLKGGQR
jgi:hypothetical protein